MRNKTRPEDLEINIQKTPNENQKLHNQCFIINYLYIGIFIVVLITLGVSILYFYPFYNSKLISQARDSNGVICSDVGLSIRSQKSKKYPFIYIGLSGQAGRIQKQKLKQQIRFDCINMCPTQNDQFNKNLQIYNSGILVHKQREDRNIKHVKSVHNSNKNNNLHRIYQQTSIEQKLNQNQNGKIQLNEQYSQGYLHTRRVLTFNEIKWPSEQQKPDERLGGVCLSDQKLSKIRELSPHLYRNLSNHQMSAYLIQNSFFIILIVLIGSIMYELITKTKLVSCQNVEGNQSVQSNYQGSAFQRQLQMSVKDSELIGNSKDNPKIDCQNNKKHFIYFILILLTSITLIIMGILQILHELSSTNLTNQNDTTDDRMFINGLFNDLIIQFNINKDFIENNLYRQILLWALLLIFALILVFLIYHVVFRYKKIILSSINYIKQAEHHLSKTKLILFSSIDSIASYSLISIAILLTILTFTCIPQAIQHQPNELFSKIKFTNNKIILISLFYSMVFSYLSMFLKQLYLYLITFQSLKSFSTQPISITLNFKDLNFICRKTLLKTLFIIPIKIVELLNINYKNQKHNSEIFSYIYKGCFCMCGTVINNLHQLGLNSYLGYCMVQKFNLMKLKQNQNSPYSQYIKLIHFLYSQGKQNTIQRPSFQVYKICYNIIKFFLTLLMAIYLQKLSSMILKYSNGQQNQQNAQNQGTQGFNLIYSIQILLGLISVYISRFSSEYIFVNAEIIQLRTIIINLVKSKKPSNNYI